LAAQVFMPTMALFDRGRPSASKPTHAHGTPPSRSCMTLKTTVSQQESAVSSTINNPTPLLVHVLHSDIESLEIPTPRRGPCHCPTVSCQHCVLPSSTSLTTTELKQRLLSMDKTIKAAYNLAQSTISSHTCGLTHLLVPIVRRDSTALLKSQTPRRRSTAPIQYWLPISYQDCCFSSIGGCFLSFPGFNALLPVSILQPRTHPITNKCPHQPIPPLQVPSDDYATRKSNLLQAALALRREILEYFAELHQESVVPTPPSGLLPTTPTDVATPKHTPTGHTLSAAASFLPSGLTETLAQFQFNPIIFLPLSGLQVLHYQHTFLFVAHQRLLRFFGTRLFSFPVESIGIRPAPEPPPRHGCANSTSKVSLSHQSSPALTFLVFGLWFFLRGFPIVSCY
jgi:hypothetical protein